VIRARRSASETSGSGNFHSSDGNYSFHGNMDGFDVSMLPLEKAILDSFDFSLAQRNWVRCEAFKNNSGSLS
jgi:hypothetical protein